MEVRYYCPRCRAKTLKLIKTRLLLGEEARFLRCERCGLVLNYESLSTSCIPGEVLRFTRSPEVYEAVREGLIVVVKRFDIVRGRVVECLEVAPDLRDPVVLERARRVIVKLLRVMSMD
jgi:DNA-directed RNA polymerase subunit RPC12/RpoP